MARSSGAYRNRTLSPSHTLDSSLEHSRQVLSCWALLPAFHWWFLGRTLSLNYAHNPYSIYLIFLDYSTMTSFPPFSFSSKPLPCTHPWSLSNLWPLFKNCVFYIFLIYLLYIFMCIYYTYIFQNISSFLKYELNIEISKCWLKQISHQNMHIMQPALREKTKTTWRRETCSLLARHKCFRLASPCIGTGQFTKRSLSDRYC